MAYKYRSRRSTRRLARQAKRNLIISAGLILILFYATITWILPSLISSLGFIKGIIQPKVVIGPKSKGVNLAPPVLNIPYEATSTAQISIRGYSTPNSKVLIYIDDELKGSTQSQEDGSFEVKDITLSLGTNSIFGKTSDGKGESLPSKPIKVIFDNEKPALEIFEPEDGKEIQGERKIKVRGKTEAQARVFINESRVITNSDGTFVTDYALNDGENILTVKTVDQASNYTEIARRVIVKQ